MPFQLYQRVRETKMNKITARKFLAVISAAALIAVGSFLVAPTAQAAAPTCTTAAGVETCTGKLTNGAAYLIKVPTTRNGTFFFWNHGFRASYPYPGYTVPTGVQELTPSSNGFDNTTRMLNSGYGVAAYDRVSAGLHNWNSVESVEMLKELIDITKAKYTVTKSVVYGSSGGAPVVNMFVEKYPGYADAVGLMAAVTNTPSIKALCDAMYILSVFADPTLKGCTALGTKGVPGHYAALGELGKVVALLTKWGGNLGAPGLEYPAALATSGIPQRSALLLTGLLIGIPQKSAHMDGISTSAVIAEHSINATVAVLENMGEAIATGILAGQAISEITGAGFYDNSTTNWSALLDDGDAGRYNLGLSGDDAINAMMGILQLAPRVKGDATAMAKFAAMDKINYSSTKPTILLANEADRLVFPGFSQLYVDKARVVYEARLAKYEAALAAAAPEKRAAIRKTKPIWNVQAIYAMTPETYTKFTAAGLPNLSAAPAPSGVGHQTFTADQMNAWVHMLAFSATTGRIPLPGAVLQFLKGDKYLNTDLDFRPIELKYTK